MMKMKKVFSIIVAFTLLFSIVLPVFADEEDDLKAQRSAAYGALDETNEALEALAAEQQEIQSQIKDINLDIVDMMLRIEQAKQDIQSTEAQIADTEAEIDATKNEISITEGNLADAESVRDKQYEDMKKRIQYIYENGGDIGWATMLLSSSDIESFFNKAEYTAQLHEYDRQQLEAYIGTVESIEELKAQLEGQKAQLEAQKDLFEDQKLALEGQKAALEDEEKKLETKLAEAEAENEDYKNQIAEAEAQAAQIQALINQMNAEIARIQEEKRKAAEEAARRAAEEAARRAAAEEAARQAALQQAAAQAQYAASAAQAAQGGEYYGPVADNSTYNSAYGTSIVDYANQFVGGAYVYGGNSLTGGIDCSHFVYNVLRNTGNYSGGYATSGNWATMGARVDSLSNARAGDVIVYSGHVAIYDGNGGIIEAQNPSAGITNNRAANDDAIVAIRRFG